MTEGAETLMTVLGLPPEVGRLYERVRAYDGLPLPDVATRLGLNPEVLRGALGPLLDHGLVGLRGEELRVPSPAQAVTAMLADMAAGAAETHARLIELSRALPVIAGAGARIPATYTSQEQPLDGEVYAELQPAETFRALVRESHGPMSWVRPSLWSTPQEDELIGILTEAVAAGRRARGIYPLRLLTEAPVALAARAEVGEEIRLLAEVPTRLLVVGGTHALLPEPIGVETPIRLVVRQPALVQTAALLFETLWDQAVPFRDLDAGWAGGSRGQRRFLLEQMASGAQDEQIARRLGVSLRTVRRRVAELLDELGAESRFQAGVEAVRRGLL